MCVYVVIPRAFGSSPHGYIPEMRETKNRTAVEMVPRYSDTTVKYPSAPKIGYSFTIPRAGTTVDDLISWSLALNWGL